MTIKREYEVKKESEITFDQHIIGVPQPETVIYETDTIVVFWHYPGHREIHRDQSVTFQLGFILSFLFYKVFGSENRNFAIH